MPFAGVFIQIYLWKNLISPECTSRFLLLQGNNAITLMKMIIAALFVIVRNRNDSHVSKKRRGTNNLGCTQTMEQGSVNEGEF